MYEVVTSPKTGLKMILEKETKRLVATLGPGVKDQEAYVLAAAPTMLLFIEGRSPYNKDYVLAKAEGRDLLKGMHENH